MNLKPYEIADEKIVLVELNSNNIKSDENNYSLISEVFKKIVSQDPSAVGLRLKHDLWAYYPMSNDRIKNFKEPEIKNLLFNQTFRLSNRLAYKLHDEKLSLATSRLPLDFDFKIRRFVARADMNELLANPKNFGMEQIKSISLPYIGVALAKAYLEKDGWIINVNPDDKIRILKGRKIVNLETSAYSSNLFYYRNSFSFLINWRKSRNQNPFIVVSANKVVKNTISSDLFRNKLVIFNNITDYKEQIFKPSISEWAKTKTIKSTDLLIAAHVASSIINSAEENRVFIKTVPQWVNLLILYLVVLFFAYKAGDSLENKMSFRNLHSNYIFYTLFVCLVLIILCLSIFIYTGFWLDIVPTLISLPISSFTYIRFCRNAKDERDFKYLRFLFKDFEHNINNVSRNISSSNRGNNRNIIEIKKSLIEDIEFFDDVGISFNDTPIGKKISSLEAGQEIIKNQILRISRYETRVSTFINYTYSNKFSKIIDVNINESMKSIVLSCLNHREADFDVEIVERYDSSIKIVKMHLEDLEILVENLVDNALAAVNPDLDLSSRSIRPKVMISTLKLNRQIQIVVEDNGIGISLPHQKQIFSPFVSLIKGGQGIGLYLVYQIIKDLDGTLILESELNQGTKFIVTFPESR